MDDTVDLLVWENLRKRQFDAPQLLPAYAIERNGKKLILSPSEMTDAEHHALLDELKRRRDAMRQQAAVLGDVVALLEREGVDTLGELLEREGDKSFDAFLLRRLRERDQLH